MAVENPRNLELVELTLKSCRARLPTSASQSSTHAIQAGLSPLEDALFLEDGDSPFANVLAVRSSRQG